MSAQKKGYFVIKGAKGTVNLAGRANSIVNSNSSAGVSDVSQVAEWKDSMNITRTITRDSTAYEMSLSLTPGIGGKVGGGFATVAELKTAADLAKIGDQIITSGFDMDSMNWASSKYARITASSLNVSPDGLMTISVTARYECELIVGVETPINWTGAWADL